MAGEAIASVIHGVSAVVAGLNDILAKPAEEKNSDKKESEKETKVHKIKSEKNNDETPQTLNLESDDEMAQAFQTGIESLKEMMDSTNIKMTEDLPDT